MLSYIVPTIPTWTPTTADLTDSSPVEVEKQAQSILHEWLKFHFDGTAKPYQGADGSEQQKIFPLANLLWQVADSVPPGEKGTEGSETNDTPHTIHVIFLDAVPTVEKRSLSVNKITVDYVANFYCRTERGGDSHVHQANKNANRDLAACLQHLTLESASKATLARYGIRNLKVTRGPVPSLANGRWQSLLVINFQFTQDIGSANGS